MKCGLLWAAVMMMVPGVASAYPLVAKGGTSGTGEGVPEAAWAPGTLGGLAAELGNDILGDGHGLNDAVGALAGGWDSLTGSVGVDLNKSAGSSLGPSSDGFSVPVSGDVAGGPNFGADGSTAAAPAGGVDGEGPGGFAVGGGGTVNVFMVPEPSAMAIAALGALGFLGYGLRRRARG